MNCKIDARRKAALALVSLAVAALALACKGEEQPAPGPVVGSNSNWLRACTSIEDCEDVPECACGVCTAGCNTDEDCAILAGARCALDASPATRSVCESDAADMTASIGPGICLPRCTPGTCLFDQVCVSEACVVAPLPATPFCDPASRPSGAQRVQEETLLALIQTRRAAGDIVCEGVAASVPQPPLRFDARLMCASRMLALDIQASRTPSVIDSTGMDTPARLTGAQYTAALWYEGFALQALDAESALEMLLQEPETCARLAGSADFDLGVGQAGDVFVVTLAVQ